MSALNLVSQLFLHLSKLHIIKPLWAPVSRFPVLLVFWFTFFAWDRNTSDDSIPFRAEALHPEYLLTRGVVVGPPSPFILVLLL